MLDLVTRKCVNPYEYTNNCGELEDTVLPEEEHFYSTLAESHLKDEEYERTVNVLNHFNYKTLSEYSSLYLKIDSKLLPNKFDNFSDMCTLTYNLDLVYYFIAPGFSFDGKLK